MPTEPCPPAQEVRLQDERPLRRLGLAQGPGYVASLATTSLGMASLQRWCVWVEPAVGPQPDRWEQRWLMAVEGALSSWSEHLPVVRVSSPDRAQVVVQRRRPPVAKPPKAGVPAMDAAGCSC